MERVAMTAHGVQVLVVEDNEKNLKLVRDLLHFRGITATEARSGREALDAVADQRPDVVLLDIDLPDMPGTEVLAELRRLDGMPSVPVLAVTAYAMKGDAERLLAAGFDGYIAKPIDVRSFVDTVLAAVSGAA
jgi:two-component system, cell cycle response regulator DivK